jgi:hypothetical protein
MDTSLLVYVVRLKVSFLYSWLKGQLFYIVHLDVNIYVVDLKVKIIFCFIHVKT